MGFLDDTNVISEFVRPQPDAQVIRWLDSADPDSLFASVVTLGEIRLGIEDLSPSKRRTDLEQWVQTGLPAWFNSHLLPITKEVADRWGCLTIASKKQGIALTTADGLIAATASAHGLTLVTRNVVDFAACGLPLVNPWEA